jgi:superfamily I DNA/RNA helicase
MCVRILRRDADRIGIERNFTIIDPTDQKSVIKDVLGSKRLLSIFSFFRTSFMTDFWSVGSIIVKLRSMPIKK